MLVVRTLGKGQREMKGIHCVQRICPRDLPPGNEPASTTLEREHLGSTGRMRVPLTRNFIASSTGSAHCLGFSGFHMHNPTAWVSVKCWETACPLSTGLLAKLPVTEKQFCVPSKGEDRSSKDRVVFKNTTTYFFARSPQRTDVSQRSHHPRPPRQGQEDRPSPTLHAHFRKSIKSFRYHIEDMNEQVHE